MNQKHFLLREVAKRLGIDKMAEAAHALGLGAPTGIELPGELGGLIPTRAWKMKRFGVPWQQGETLVNGIGITESADELNDLRRRFFAHCAPVGPIEEMLVEQIVSCCWRKRRVLQLMHVVEHMTLWTSGSMATSLN